MRSSAKSPQIAAARERYRELALAAVDIIDLANLPELDRHVATRQLELRKLYVPLHVTTEAAPGQEIDESKLAELEERRKGGGPEAHAGARVPIGQRLWPRRGGSSSWATPAQARRRLVRWIATAYLLRLKHEPGLEAPAEHGHRCPTRTGFRSSSAAATSTSPAWAATLDDVLRRTFRKSEMTAEEADALMIAFREDLRDGPRCSWSTDSTRSRTRRSGRGSARNSSRSTSPTACVPRRDVADRGLPRDGHPHGRGFEHVTVADLSSDDKDDFARRWCALTEPPQRRETAAQDLINDIHSGDRIERLTGNPMLLTTMALVKRKVGKLPSGRAELYGDAVDVLLALAPRGGRADRPAGGAPAAAICGLRDVRARRAAAARERDPRAPLRDARRVRAADPAVAESLARGVPPVARAADGHPDTGWIGEGRRRDAARLRVPATSRSRSTWLPRRW